MSEVVDALLAELDEIAEKARVSFSKASGSVELHELEVRYLSKRGRLAEISKTIASLDIEGKKVVGRTLIDARTSLNQLLQDRVAQEKSKEDQRLIISEAIDLSEYLEGPSSEAIGSLHLVTQTRQALEDVFVGMGFAIAEGPEVETEWNNFEALNIPRFHPARASQDSFFISGDEIGQSTLLRTHTSPVQVRTMLTQPPPIYIIAPGRVYRRDTPDARHTPAFHQIEGLVVDKGISFAHLAGTVETFTKAYFGPDISSRLRPAYFPFTEPSAEFEITCTICRGAGCRTCSNTGWIELGGCGMVHPNVFRAVGIDSEVYSGFAFGFGIDRCTQMKYQISDMRVFLDNDVRFLSQFRG